VGHRRRPAPARIIEREEDSMMAKLTHTGFYGWVYNLDRGVYIRAYALEEPEDLERLGFTMFPTVENFALKTHWTTHDGLDESFLVLVTDLEHNELYRDHENIAWLSIVEPLFVGSLPKFLKDMNIKCKSPG